MEETKKTLSYEETTNPEAVEQLFCQPLDENGTREPLSEDMMSVLLAVILSDEAKTNEMFESAKKISVAVSIIESRAKSMGLVLDKKTLIFFGLISGTPGIAVMYTYFLAYSFKRMEKETMKFDEIILEIFPVGTFSEKSLTDHWDMQKVERRAEDSGELTSDNLLDYPEASKSISKEPIL
jgi:hypothetical protein